MRSLIPLANHHTSAHTLKNWIIMKIKHIYSRFKGNWLHPRKVIVNKCVSLDSQNRIAMTAVMALMCIQKTPNISSFNVNVSYFCFDAIRHFVCIGTYVCLLFFKKKTLAKECFIFHICNYWIKLYNGVIQSNPSSLVYHKSDFDNDSFLFF